MGICGGDKHNFDHYLFIKPNLPTRLETRTKESSMCASLKMVIDFWAQ